jgi:HlyD family secretion protein
MRRMALSRRTWAGIGIAVLVVAGLALGFRDPSRVVDIREVRRAPLAVSFQEEGRTRLKERFAVAAPVAGTLRRVALREGDAVRAGQVLAEIDPASAALLDPASRARLRAEADAASAAVRAAQGRMAAASAAERQARRERERLEGMRASGAVSPNALDAAVAAAARAAAELDAARADEAAAKQRELAVRVVLGEEGRSGGGVALPLVSPVDGVVLRRHIESAVPVAAGSVVLEVGDPRALEIEVEALSTDAVRVRAGQGARVLRWGGEGTLAARVQRVEPGGFTKVSALGVEEQRVRVILDFDEPAERWAALGDGYRVEVEFITWQAEDVLQVPAPALFRLDGRWMVYVDDGGRARPREVAVGERNAEAAQVLSGLEVGERVVAYPDERIADGVRVRAAGR